MKKAYLLVLMITLFTFNIGAKALTLNECEYSKEFREWLKLSAEKQAIIPMPAICQHSYDQLNINLKANPTANDPSFNLKEIGYVTSVKNQKQTNSCWAYSTVASIESNLLKNNGPIVSLSPGHMELSTQNNLYASSRNPQNFNRAFNQGGNYYLSAAYLLNQWGPINENTTYSVDTLMDIIKGTSTISANTVENEKPIYSVNDIAYIMSESCDSATKSSIKNYLVQNGAIAASIYMGVWSNDAEITSESIIKDKFTNGEYYYYNGEAYMSQDGASIAANQRVGHAVTIVGWDDTIDKSNFAIEPNANGAWLVKNSWGTTAATSDGNTYQIGKDGYYYVSYEDVNICSNLAGFYNVDSHVSDNVYYYDDLGWIDVLGTQDTNTLYIGNVYENNSGKKEIIDKVTFGTSQVGLNYTIYYSPNGSLTNYQNNILKSGTVDHTGYTTVKINNYEINSAKYGIVIKLTNPSSNLVTFPIAIKVPDTIFANYTLTQNVSFVSSNGAFWEDTASVNFNAMNSIRVYTTSTNDNINDNNPITDDDDDTNPVKPDDDIHINPTDDSILPGVGDNVVDSPNTGIEDINIPMLSMLFVSTTAFILLKKIVIFQKI